VTGARAPSSTSATGDSVRWVSDQITLATPDISLSVKMSPNTWNSSMIQMKNRKNQRIDQNTCPVPNVAIM
jgi:hypothetical protein